jgi:hypothetical protein
MFLNDLVIECTLTPIEFIVTPTITIAECLLGLETFPLPLLVSWWAENNYSLAFENNIASLWKYHSSAFGVWRHRRVVLCIQ